ncbi:MAG: threonine synthase, partial [Flavobacterium sp.]
MKYFSLNKKAEKVSFRQAVIKGLAPDKGLYFPDTITKLPAQFFEEIEQLEDHEIAFHVIEQFVGGAIPDTELNKILKEVLSFEFPLVEVKPDIFSLELFHGPTLAFKDVGARFMARCLGYFNQEEQAEKVTVLV